MTLLSYLTDCHLRACADAEEEGDAIEDEHIHAPCNTAADVAGSCAWNTEHQHGRYLTSLQFKRRLYCRRRKERERDSYLERQTATDRDRQRAIDRYADSREINTKIDRK